MSGAVAVEVEADFPDSPPPKRPPAEEKVGAAAVLPAVEVAVPSAGFAEGPKRPPVGPLVVAKAIRINKIMYSSNVQTPYWKRLTR
jgi:hypothetical protein